MDYYKWSTNRVSECLQLVIDGEFFFDSAGHVPQETQKTIATAVLEGWNQQLKTFPIENEDSRPYREDGGGRNFTESELDTIANRMIAELSVFSTFCESCKVKAVNQ
jgi:hypothetical protein